MLSNANPECFVFNDGNKSNEMLTASLLGSNGGFGGGMWNNPIWAIVFLAALRNGGIFGNDGYGCKGGSTQNQLDAIQAQLNSNQNSTLLMDAIKGNQNAVHELATSIGCSFNSVQTAINGVQASISNVSNQVGMSSAQVINAIQSGNMNIANILQSCCCDVRQDVTKMGYENQINNLQQSQLIQNGFSQVGYASAEQTCAIKQAIADQTIAISNKLDSQESARKDREISALTAQLASVTARAERQTELAPLYEAIKDVQCKQPQTVTLPYSCATAVPTNLVYQSLYGLNTYSNGGVFG